MSVRMNMVFVAVAGLSFALCAEVYAVQSLESNLSDYSIVLADGCIAAEKTAASELQQYIAKITGKKLPIITNDEFKSGSMIAVGFNGSLPSVLSRATFEKKGGIFKPEEIIIACDGKTLLLAGGRPRGTLYAVYEFLHRLGVRWYSPEFEKVPSMNNIPLRKEVYRYVPPFFSRSEVAGNHATQLWSARNRLNSFVLWSPLEIKYGGGIGQGPDMHTLSRMLKTADLKAHPEWMAMVDGKREEPVTGTWGVCLSNEDLRKHLVEQTMKWARANRDRQCIWFGQNDGSDPCQCDKCKAFYAAHGGEPSSLIVQMANELADAVKMEFPDKYVKTLAYSWSLKPPVDIKLRSNVIIMFCAYGEYDIPIRIDGSDFRKSLRASIAGWRKIAENLEVYLYPFPHENYWFVSPSIFAGCDNIKWAIDNGVKNVYTQISGFGDSTGSEAVDIRAWVFARLFWNPSQDPVELVRDFCMGYYGPAGQTVFDVVMMTHSGVLNENNNVKKFHDHPIVPQDIEPAKIRKINIVLEKAYNQLVDPVYKKHLSSFWLSYLWTDFWLGYEGLGEYDEKTGLWQVVMNDGTLRNRYGQLIKQFMTDNGISALRENRTLNPKLLATDKMGVSYKACILKGKNATAVVVPAIAGRIERFVDRRVDFMPFKPYWGFLMQEYPLYGSTRDFVNGSFVAEYKFLSHNKDLAVLQGNADSNLITKKVGFHGDTLAIELLVKAGRSEKIKVSPAVMLDLQDKGFGEYPTVYVQKKDGTWSSRVLGKASNFWYQAGAIDISNTTGKVLIAAEKNKSGLMLTFDPKNITSLTFEYDRNDKYPQKGGRMMWLNPTAEFIAHIGMIYPVNVQWQIISEYETVLNPEKSSK